MREVSGVLQDMVMSRRRKNIYTLSYILLLEYWATFGDGERFSSGMSWYFSPSLPTFYLLPLSTWSTSFVPSCEKRSQILVKQSESKESTFNII